MLDSIKHRALRERLIVSLAEKGITDEAVLTAMQKVPRHFFVESAFGHAAYEDRALPIAEGQTISQPFTVAYQTQLMGIKPKMKVLEIGTGSGYQCAVLCEMGANVFTVEIIRKLYQKAAEILSDLEYSLTMNCGDGSMGWDKYQYYDRILVTAASPSIPDVLKKQLAIGGKLIIPVGTKTHQEMCCVIRKSVQEFEIQRLDKFKFVPLTGANGFKE